MEELNDNTKWSAYKKAKERVEELKGFYWHLVIFIIFQSFLFLNYFLSIGWAEGMELWIVFLIFFGWGIGLVLHAVQVFGKHAILGKDWEERKIRELMEQEREFEKDITNN